jgi:hypothetical protein
MEGRGIFTYVNGDEYNGQWVNGKMHGRGKFVWSNGEVFDGDWANDVMIPESQKNVD